VQTNNAQREIESTFEAKSSKFRIEASSKAFQILSSNLYTDKPLAIMRELACNALDAHWEAECKEPFQIILPTALNPSLEFHDYGIGMSPEKIGTLFTTFFASDKNLTNAVIGGLGLGSKTPFSYTDTFTLVSYWEGMKYTFLCYIDEEGEPSIQAAGEPEPSEEPRGIHYIIPVKNEDFSTFRYKAQAVLKYFPEDSYTINTDISPQDYAIKNDMYGLRANASYDEKHMNVLMGPVAYKMDKEALPEKIQSRFRSLLREKPIDVFCNIGDIDIQASREALSYDKRSQKKIEVVLQAVKDRIKDDMEKELVNCSTYLEACAKATELSSDFSFNIDSMYWRGTKLTTDFAGEECDIVSSGSLTANNQLRLNYSRYHSLNAQRIMEAKIMLYDPSIPMSNHKLKHYLLENPSINVVVFRNETKMLNWMWRLQLFDHSLVEDLPMPPEKELERTTKGTRRKTAPVKLKIRTGFNEWEAATKTIEEINELENACWAPLSGGGYEPWAKDTHADLYRAVCNLSGDAVKMVGIPKSLMHKAKSITLPYIEEFVRFKMIEFIDTEERYNMAFIARSELKWMPEYAQHVPEDWHHLEVSQYALEYRNLSDMRRQYRHVCGDLFKWDIDKKFSLIEEAEYRKKYKVFRVLDHMYSREKHLISDVLELIHGENDGVHNQQPVSDNN